MMYARCTRYSLRLAAFAVLFFIAVMATGCKPDLSNDQALALIQADYDHRAPAPMVLNLDQTGLQDGLTAKYWALSRLYPNNKLWADYTLTDEGKKLVKLASGKDVIEWRQDPKGDFQYEITTIAPLKLKAREVKEIRDEIVPGVKGPGKVVVFMETKDVTALPDALQAIARNNPKNKIAAKRQADMALENGAWVFHAME
jgi:hypothetical protein